MRMVFGVLSLLLAVAVVGALAKKQLGGLTGAGTAPTTSAGVALPVGTPQQRSQQVQNQVKKSVEDAMQQRRPELDDQ